MALQLKGADKLIQKLNKLSHIEAKKVIHSAADDVERALVNKAKQFSDKEYQYIGKADVREYANSCFIDVGLHSNNASFNDYKGLYFHNWGYNNWGHGGRYNGMYMGMHVMWFQNAIASIEQQTLEKIKRKVKAEIKAFNKL